METLGSTVSLIVKLSYIHLFALQEGLQNYYTAMISHNSAIYRSLSFSVQV